MNLFRDIVLGSGTWLQKIVNGNKILYRIHIKVVRQALLFILLIKVQTFFRAFKINHIQDCSALFRSCYSFTSHDNGKMMVQTQY